MQAVGRDMHGNEGVLLYLQGPPFSVGEIALHETVGGEVLEGKVFPIEILRRHG
jgi:hypothetical protein